MARWIRYDRQRHMLTIGSRFWAFTTIRVDDDYDWDDNGNIDIAAYRQIVIHVGRFHICTEWKR